MGIGRVAAAAATGVIGLGLLAGCGEWNTDSYSDSDAVGQSFESVRFTNDSGDVTIRAGDKAEVKRTVHYGDKKPGDTFRVKDGVLALDSCTERNCWIDYEVTVPAGTRVSGELDSGKVDISGVADVNLRASSGEVNVTDVDGAVNIEASSGSVRLDEIGGPVVAKVDSGNVEVGLAKAADVRVGADSGNVDVTVPDGSYKVTTSADSGSVDSGIDDDPSGEHVIDVHADSGNIRVSAA
jgi:DUF4097 and DUF4098 domain-containing protein YvlB